MENDHILQTFAFDNSIGIDVENHTIKGVIVCQIGSFRDNRPGCFNGDTIKAVLKLINDQPDGLPCFYSHAHALDVCGSPGQWLGRLLNARLDGGAVRADLVFDPTSLSPSPESGMVGYGQYVLALAASDPGALGMSVAFKRFHTVPGQNGGPAALVPDELLSCDVVTRGAATRSLMSEQPIIKTDDSQSRNRLSLLKMKMRLTQK
jgi:hypothetical protein